MREKRKFVGQQCILGVVCILIVLWISPLGCGVAKDYESSIVDANEQLLNSGRAQGYNEAYIEFWYGITQEIPEDMYLKYTDAKTRYETNMSIENYNLLVDATQEIVQLLNK